MIELHTNCPAHFDRFIALNEAWVEQYFALEDADRKLADDPNAIIRNGGAIITATEEDTVVGACALVHHDGHFELARMAVDENFRGCGIGRKLADAVIALARDRGAHEITLLSNTVLVPAIALYESLGFEVVSTGTHPVYSRCNVVMKKQFDPARSDVSRT